LSLRLGSKALLMRSPGWLEAAGFSPILLAARGTQCRGWVALAAVIVVAHVKLGGFMRGKVQSSSGSNVPLADTWMLFLL